MCASIPLCVSTNCTQRSATHRDGKAKQHSPLAANFSSQVRNRSWMSGWRKNRGYPQRMRPTTRASPCSYPRLSAHVGRQTETACRVAGIGLPRSLERQKTSLGGGVTYKPKREAGCWHSVCQRRGKSSRGGGNTLGGDFDCPALYN